MCGTLSYFDAEASAWRFNSKLELPPLTAKHSNVLEMTRKGFHAAAAAAGLLNEWPHCIAFLVVHCEISEMMSVDNASLIWIPVQGPRISSGISSIKKFRMGNEGETSRQELSCTELGESRVTQRLDKTDLFRRQGMMPSKSMRPTKK
jgi:hypothetical protein